MKVIILYQRRKSKYISVNLINVYWAATMWQNLFYLLRIQQRPRMIKISVTMELCFSSKGKQTKCICNLCSMLEDISSMEEFLSGKVKR